MYFGLDRSGLNRVIEGDGLLHAVARLGLMVLLGLGTAGLVVLTVEWLPEMLTNLGRP